MSGHYWKPTYPRVMTPGGPEMRCVQCGMEWAEYHGIDECPMGNSGSYCHRMGEMCSGVCPDCRAPVGVSVPEETQR